MVMKPIEKAKQLYEKFSEICQDYIYGKKAALACCEELYRGCRERDNDFWVSVHNELEKL